MKIRILLFVLFSLLIGFSFSTCIPTQRSLALSAVVNDSAAQLIEVKISTIPGKGDVLISSTGSIGESTRYSLNTAADVAFRMLNKQRDCDIIFKIKTPVESIDGPSGGAGFTILIASALEKKEIIKNFSITGTIEENGMIGYVGKIPSKYEAFAKSGGKLMIVPVLEYYDKLSLLALKKYYKTDFYESSAIKDAYEIATGKNPTLNYSMPIEKELSFTYAQKAPLSFKKISEKMLASANEKLKYVDKNLLEHFNSRIKNSENALNTNNFYTSSNLLFLTLIDMDFSKFSLDRFETEKEELEKCWESYESELQKTGNGINNFEIVSSSEVRYAWSKLRSNASLGKKIDRDNIANNLQDFYDIINSKYWCYAAIDFIQIANSSNGSVDSYVKDFAIAKYEEAKNHSNDEFQLRTSEYLINEGKYLASIFSSSMALSDWKASSMNASEEVNFTFIWPQLYYNHAVVYRDVYNDSVTYRKLYALAVDLENSLREAKKLIEEKLIEEKINEMNVTNKTANVINVKNITNVEKKEEKEIVKERIANIEEIRNRYILILIALVALILAIYIAIIVRIKKKMKESKMVETIRKPKGKK